MGFETGIVGFERYRFTPRGFAGPNSCDGFFFHGSSGKVYRLIGRKLTGRDCLPQDETGKRQLASENLAQAKTVPVSAADFGADTSLNRSAESLLPIFGHDEA